MWGTILNGAAIIFGSLIGVMFRKLIIRVPQRSCFQILGVGIAVMSITGVCSSMLAPELTSFGGNALVAISISFIIGGLIGELCKLEAHTDSVSKRLGSKWNNASVMPAALNGCMIFIIGALQIIGPLNSVLLGDNSMLITKSIIDFPLAIVYGAVFGFGTALAAIPMMLMQFLIGMCAPCLSPMLTADVLAQLGAVGYIILFCTGLNLLFDKVVKINTINLIPSVIIVFLINVVR